MEVGRTHSGRIFGVCVDNVPNMQRRRERSSFCGPPRGYFATLAPTAGQPESVCKEVQTHLQAEDVDFAQAKCFFNTDLPAAAPQFLELCDVEQLFVSLVRVEAEDIWETLSDKDEALAHLYEYLIDRAPWEQCLRWRGAFQGEEAAYPESTADDDGVVTFKVECDCSAGTPAILSSAEIVENAGRMLQEKFGWTMDSDRATLEVQLFVTDTSFVAGLSVHKSSTSGTQPPACPPPDSPLAEAVQELHLDPSPADLPAPEPSSTSGSSQPVDKREEAKRRRAEEKRKKEQEKKQKDQDKKKAAAAEVARQKQEARGRRRAAREAEADSDVVCTIYQTTTLTEADIQRAEAKSARENVRQQQWAYNDADMTKDELRDYYKTMKSKPKGKGPVKSKREFADQ
uniref:Uncharacterized protein n=1 Tax=Pyramimonas obovata TaxID=1411642 RepID=A0A7S0WK49_9CHLO|mmetsp:Transcript_28109/g.61537  ORF Transcript_28109/g.61537 Transcript_28109/m.61537 type:complete len:400 (+) Transcript_28109:297-1496(+)|eukprot:CAMPEP_0118932062 /NCGR_PEP_ID=MMETSP1169-20130426/8989_1 /TAXON_ID=36882 /ORGANISM="Pyramimonas obovata, Strain CCMP722" /LENGTH=399 /DNA_ID=CAMNT_0006874657 /DNA_START=297 /DNA_END=1496 /DNA_ORIENTATION=+